MKALDATDRWSPSSSSALGKPWKRLEDVSLLTGNGTYVADLATEDTLHAHFVRSPVAHGVFHGIDTAEARSLPGVIDIVTSESLGLPDLLPPPGVDRSDVGRPHLARDRVRYVGEPLAMVVSDDAARAADAADLVWPKIDELPVALKADPAVAAGAPKLFEESNVIARSSTRSEVRITKHLPIQVSLEVHNQRVAAVAIEGLAILVEPQSGGRVKVVCSHQAPHRLRGQLAATLNIDPTLIQVVVPDVGGAFGLKGMYFTEYATCAAVAMRLNAPVMWLETRREHLVAGMHGRDQTHRITLEGEETGRIRRASIEIVADVGAYPQSGAIIPTLTRSVVSGLYDIDEVNVDMSVVVTNRAPTASYRGAGRPEAAFTIERAIDLFASEVNLDPAEIRRINFIRPAQLPYRTGTGALYDSGNYEAALDLALNMIDVESLRADQKERLASGANPIGLGLGAFIERTGGAIDTGEFADVELDRSGNLIVRTGSTDSGQGHRTVWTQTLCEVFDVDSDHVEVRAGDTNEVQEGVGTYASRSAQLGASAAYRTAISVRESARKIAAEMLEASPFDIQLAAGIFTVVGSPGSDVSLSEVANEAARRGDTIRAQEMFIPGAQTFPYGIHIAVVEVDLQTGAVLVHRLVTVDDCGNVLNPMIADGQLQGSLVQGLGQALLECVVYNQDGSPLTGTLMDYLIPNAAGVPDIVSERLVTPAPSNPLGVKGTGEAGCIGAPPAIVNAVLDALRPYGVTNLEMPLRPDRVWSALRAARESI